MISQRPLKVCSKAKPPYSTACASHVHFMTRIQTKSEQKTMVSSPILPYNITKAGILIIQHATAWQVMNEVALHRGSSPHLNTIDIFVDGQHLTEAVVSYPRCLTISSFFTCSSLSQTASSSQLRRAQQHTPYQLEVQSSTRH